MKFCIESVLSWVTPKFFTESERGTEKSPSWMDLTETEESFCFVPTSMASVLSLFLTSHYTQYSTCMTYDYTQHVTTRSLHIFL